MAETCGRPRPHEREGPTSEAQWEGRAVEDCDGFQTTYLLPASGIEGDSGRFGLRWM